MAFNAPKINPLNVSGIASGLRTSMDRLRSDNQRAWDQTMKGFESVGQAAKTYRDIENENMNNEAVKAYLKLIQDDEDDDKAIKDLQDRIAALKLKMGGSSSAPMTSPYNVGMGQTGSLELNSPNVLNAVARTIIGKKAGI